MITAGDGHDDVYGGSGNDWIRGGEGSDDLFGGEGDDKIYGEPGNDVLVGDSGFDLLDAHGDCEVDFLFAEDGEVDILRVDGGLCFDGGTWIEGLLDRIETADDFDVVEIYICGVDKPVFEGTYFSLHFICLD